MNTKRTYLKKNKNHNYKPVIYIIVSALLALGMFSCAADAVPPAADGTENTESIPETSAGKPEASHLSAINLMQNVKAGNIAQITPDGEFIAGSAAFALDLFKKSALAGGNPMVSPLSVMLALSMTTNGAAGETLAQMERVLGGLDIGRLNEYMRGYTASLTNTENAKLTAANSVWFRDDGESIRVSDQFLQTNADYYNADAYAASFDDKTLEEINEWVNVNTDGMIDGILDRIPEEAVMYLINAMAFDARWEKVSNEHQISEGTFNALDGAQTVSMMQSQESEYIDDGRATGFIKPYEGGQYSFAALLPNEGVDIHDYIASMTADAFIAALSDTKSGIVYATLPKFTSEYKTEVNGTLQELGMTDAFMPSNADFSGLVESSLGNFYIS
ncbi:MAG: serpin family protein, partial [Eubacteriales bacterium]|nr:serpin family protein [Eubacteriales bacterium]